MTATLPSPSGARGARGNGRSGTSNGLYSEAAAVLQDELRQRLTGEVRFDPVSRMLYSTDASNYQIEPVGVVIPATQDDVLATI